MHAEEANRIAKDPNASMKTVEAVCKEKYKTLMRHTEDGVAKDQLRNMGAKNYAKAVKNMVKTGQIQTPDSWPQDARSVAEATARAAINAKEAYGDKKLAELHSALSFCRCVSGKPRKARSVYVAWICP